MTGIRRIFILFLSLVLILSATAISTADGSNVKNIPHAHDALLVQFDKSMPEQAKNDHMKALGLERLEKLGNYGLERIKVNGNQSVESVVEKLNAQEGVVFAEPDYILYASVTPADDPYYGLLWGLNNTGQSVNGTIGVADIDIDAPEAWAIESGEPSVIVAVIDTGVEATHPDLAANLLPGVKFMSAASVYDHGTHVAGTIAAVDNAQGVVGVAPSVKVLPLEFLGKSGGYTSDAIKAIQYATGKADIINASWGGGGYSQALKDAIEAFGGPFVAAAGNDGVNTDSAPHYPSAYNSANIISVAAVQSNGNLASFSNYGTTSVDVGAPGVTIASTYQGGGYVYMSGTSMAAPHVSGVMALLKSYKPSASASEMINALYASGMPLPSLNGKTATGKMVNALGALEALSPPPSDVTPPVEMSTVPVSGATNVDLGTEISVTYNENIQFVSTPLITINGAMASASISGAKVIMTPGAALDYSIDYTVMIPANTIQDMSGNAVSADYSFTFKTMTEPQVLNIDFTGTNPTNGAVNVKRTQTISFYTDQVFTSVDVSKIKFLDSSNNKVSFSYSGVGTQELRIKTSSKMNQNMNYHIILEAGALKNGLNTSVLKDLSFKTGTR